MVKRDKHTLNGATLDVSLELRDNAQDTGKTIQITGLAARTTEDSIWNYFENKRRSGGGEVETVDFRPEAFKAFVTFKDVDGKSLIQLTSHFLARVTIVICESQVKRRQYPSELNCFSKGHAAHVVYIQPCNAVNPLKESF